MNKLFCDKCNKEITKCRFGIEVSGNEGYVDSVDGFNSIYIEKELCETCYNQFKKDIDKWLK